MEINGLPLHPLVVHAAVVFGPLGALLALGYVSLPARRDRLRLPMLGLALTSATASAQKVTYDYDKATDFTKIRTYAWVHTREEVQDELNHKRIVNAVDAQLSAKGLTKVQEGGMADVLVAYGVGIDRNLEINGSSSDWGGPLYRGNRTGSARTQEVMTGTLVVAMADPETKSVIWRGVASKDLDQSASPEKRDKNLNKAVAKTLEKYPPKQSLR